eukprot:976338-Pyramimonas_sp.AAC.1
MGYVHVCFFLFVWYSQVYAAVCRCRVPADGFTYNSLLDALQGLSVGDNKGMEVVEEMILLVSNQLAKQSQQKKVAGTESGYS